ncbi:MAG: acetyl-CoA carboxylase carboxyl transferase subunit alpha, partial [Pelagibacteraceae bacterium]
SIEKNLNFFKDMTSEEIFNHRKNKFLKIGRNKGFINNPEDLSALTPKNKKFNNVFKSKKLLIYSAIAFSAIILSLLIFL